MSYVVPEWVRPMLQERWGRLVEDSVDDVGASEWKHNNRPRELASEYLKLAEWAQHLERQLDGTTKLLSALGDSLADFSAKTIREQVNTSQRVLKTTPGIKVDDDGA